MGWQSMNHNTKKEMESWIGCPRKKQNLIWLYIHRILESIARIGTAIYRISEGGSQIQMPNGLNY